MVDAQEMQSCTASSSSRPAVPTTTTVESTSTESWSVYLSKALMAALIANLPPATAADILFTIFFAFLEGPSASKEEAKKWRVEAEGRLVELRRQLETAEDTRRCLQSHIQKLEEFARVSQDTASKERDQFQEKARLSEEDKVRVEAQLRVTAEAVASERAERRREVEGLQRRLQQWSEDARKKHATAMADAEAKVKAKESENEIRKLQAELDSATQKNAALEAEAAKTAQRIGSLESRLSEAASREAALRQQLQSLARLPTRRFY